MRDIVIRHELAYPADVVWDALTDPRQLAEWLMPNDFEPIRGHEFRFVTRPAPGFDGVVNAKVLEIDPPRLLALSWRGGGIDTVVRFELEPANDGTVLTLRQSGFRGLRQIVPRIVLGFGWARNIRTTLPRVLSRR